MCRQNKSIFKNRKKERTLLDARTLTELDDRLKKKGFCVHVHEVQLDHDCREYCTRIEFTIRASSTIPDIEESKLDFEETDSELDAFELAMKDV